MKILHCPDIVGGNAQQLARSERALGADSKSIIFKQNYFQYQSDEVLLPPNASRLALEIARWRLLFRALSYDVIHYNFGQSIMSMAIHHEDQKLKKYPLVLRYLIHSYTHLVEMLDVKLFKALGKRIFVTYQGDDIRQGEFCRNNFEVTFANHVDKEYYTPHSDALKKNRIAKFEKYANKCFALNPDLMYLLNKNAEFCPYSHIDLEEWIPGLRSEKSEVPIVVHAPSHKDVKGTKYILEVVKKLKAKGINFEFILVEGLSHAEARRHYERADLLIDQLLAGWYGGLAVELMALGKPVISYIRNEDLKFIPQEMRDEIPIISASPATIESVLEHWLTEEKDELHKRGLASRAFVEKWHSPKKIATNMLREYSSAVSIPFFNRGIEGSLKKNFLVLVGGTVIAQIINFISTPLLTRVYSPSDFATVASYIGFISVISVAATGRYEMAIMHAKNEEEANFIAALSIFVLGLFTSVITVLLIFTSADIVSLMNVPDLEGWMPWIGAPIFGLGLLNTFMNRLTWQKKFNDISRGRVVQYSANTIVSLVGGWALKAQGVGMLWGYVLGIAFSVGFLFYKINLNLYNSFNYKKIKSLLKRFIHYPFFATPAAILDVASMYACIFILGKFYPTEVLGQFSLTHRLLLIPMVLVGDAVARIFFQRATELVRQDGDLRALLWNTSKKLLIYSAPFFIGLAILAPFLFKTIFGSAWVDSGMYARWIIPAYWLRLAVSPISTIFMVTHKIRLGSLWQFFYFCTSYSVLGAAAFLDLPVTVFLLVYAVHEMVLYGLYFLMANRACLNNSNLKIVE